MSIKIDCCQLFLTFRMSIRNLAICPNTAGGFIGVSGGPIAKSAMTERGNISLQVQIRLTEKSAKRDNAVKYSYISYLAPRNGEYEDLSRMVNDS